MTGWLVVAGTLAVWAGICRLIWWLARVTR